MFKLRVKQVIIYESNIMTKKAKVSRYLARDLKNLCILLKNSAEGLGSRREHCLSNVVSVFENTAQKLGVEATC